MALSARNADQPRASHMAVEAREGRAVMSAPATAPRKAGDQERQTLFMRVVYATVAIGYLMAIVGASALTLWPFLLFTLLNIAWLLIFARPRGAPTWRELGALSGIAVAALFCLPLGLGYDWLLAVITSTVVAFTQRWPETLGAMLLFSVASAIALHVGGAGWSNILQTLAQTIPAYVFVAIFAFTMRRQQELRERAEDLAATVARAKAELEVAHQELRQRASQAEELAVTRERNRMAREIHDTLGHYLTVLAVELETALKLEERGHTGLRDELTKARQVAGECLQAVRRSVTALRPAELSLVSLEEALRRLVEESETLLPETRFTLDIESDTHALSPEIRAALYRCAQEALTNVRKHAAASNVLVRLRVDAHDGDAECAQAHKVELTVLDNGRGAQENAAGGPAEEHGFGLVSMRERIESVGGTLRAGAEPERGWRVEARIPLAQALEDAPTSALAPLASRLSGDAL
jgi:signal transduction histidine kinase